MICFHRLSYSANVHDPSFLLWTDTLLDCFYLLTELWPNNSQRNLMGFYCDGETGWCSCLSLQSPILTQAWEVSRSCWDEIRLSTRLWDCGDIASACRNATVQQGQDRGSFELIALADTPVQSLSSLIFFSVSVNHCAVAQMSEHVFLDIFLCSDL